MKYLWNNLVLFVTRSYARGVWLPLLCAICICLITLGLIVFVDFITCSNVSLGRVIELMLDPGAFSSAEKPATVFQLIITLIGAVVFTSLLITTVSNMFSNQAEAYRNGECRITMKDHILILGTSQVFYNSLDFFLGQSGPIVILTSVPTKEVRSKISSYIGTEKADKLILISGDRRFPKNLERVSFDRAKEIYILGEDNEKDHDAANISCLKELCRATKDDRDIRCLIEIDSPEVLLLFTQTKWDLKGVRLRYFNPDELLANKLLINDGTSGLQLQYLDSDDVRSQHLIVIGTSGLSSEIAKLFLKIAHYPNFVTGKIRSRLTVIDENSRLALGLQSNLKDVCHVYEYGRGTDGKDTFKADEYDDFLDFEINHITGTVSDEHVRLLLEKFRMGNDLISVVIASDDSDRNFRDAISLPDYIYETDRPVFVYQPVTGLVIDRDNLPVYYDNLEQFGLNISVSDVYRKNYTDATRASLYADLMIGMKKGVVISDEFIDEHFMKSGVLSQQQHSSRALYVQYLFGVGKGDRCADGYFLKGLHQNWMASSLLGVYRMMPKALWDTYNAKLSGPDNRDARIALHASKEISHQLYYMTSYDLLDPMLREYDSNVAYYIYDYLARRG